MNKLILGNSAGVAIKSSTILFALKFLIQKPLHDIHTSGSLKAYKVSKEGAKRTLKNHRKEYIRLLRIIINSLKQPTPNIQEIQAKTLILASTRDELFPLEDQCILNKNIPQSELKVFNSNHSWMAFKPNEFEQAIHNFI